MPCFLIGFIGAKRGVVATDVHWQRDAPAPPVP